MGKGGWGRGKGRSQIIGCRESLFINNSILSALHILYSIIHFYHRLNMELDLQSLFGFLCAAVLIGWDPATPPLPPHLVSNTRAPLVSQDRRPLFITPWDLCLRCIHLLYLASCSDKFCIFTCNNFHGKFAKRNMQLCRIYLSLFFNTKWAILMRHFWPSFSNLNVKFTESADFYYITLKKMWNKVCT